MRKISSKEALERLVDNAIKNYNQEQIKKYITFFYETMQDYDLEHYYNSFFDEDVIVED